jgi:cardiolipin synthase
MNAIEILATGPELIKEGLRGIEPVMEEIIISATSEIKILAYLFTPQAVHFLDLLRNAADRGIKITMILNSLESQHEIIRNELNLLASRYPHVKIINFSGKRNQQLHAKIIIADRKRAVVGSANFSWGGMYANYEVGLFVEGEIAWKLADIVDHLSTMLK